MKIGIISLGGKSSKAVAKECKNYFDKVDELDLRKFEVHLTDDGIKVAYGGEELAEYDCLYIRGSFRYSLLQRSISRALNHKTYIPIKPEAYTLGHDKLLTLLELQKEGIAIPSTYCTTNTSLAENILKNHVGYPAIMKLSEGTHGKGVMLADSLKSAKTILDMFDSFNKPFVIQEFVKTKKTSDIRAIVVGHKVVAAYKRQAAKGEVRANIHSGGERKPHKLSKEEEKLAVLSAKTLGVEICGVDLLNSKSPSVVEINLSPAIQGIRSVTKKNVAKEIAKYLKSKTEEFIGLNRLKKEK